MKKYIIALDLGTTNIKAGIYDNKLNEISIYSDKVNYKNAKPFVEFDPEEYWQNCRDIIRKNIEKSKIDPKNISSLALTGQAETLVMIDKNNEVLGDAISWMDNRSTDECEYLKKTFNSEESYIITGQPEIITTWPITKILWIKRNQESRFKKVCKYLLLKDFIVFKLTGRIVTEFSVSSFTYYLDIINKRYWKDIIDYVGVDQEQLPLLEEPGKNIQGHVPEAAKDLNLNSDLIVNIGMLDHFSGMIGVGNIEHGILSESTGTVMAIATILKKPDKKLFPIPFHYGPFKDNYSLLPVCESGGICFEWFKDNFYPDKGFKEIDLEIEESPKYEKNDRLTFLPYILGANSPEYNNNIKGIFYGITINHKRYDFARSVLEGISFLLKKNIDFLSKNGLEVKKIISMGGAAKSELWNKMKADIIQQKIHIPYYKESTLYGASILAAAGLHNSSVDKILKNIKLSSKEMQPDANKRDYYHDSYELFSKLYEKLSDLN